MPTLNWSYSSQPKEHMDKLAAMKDAESVRALVSALKEIQYDPTGVTLPGKVKTVSTVLVDRITGKSMTALVTNVLIGDDDKAQLAWVIDHMRNPAPIYIGPPIFSL